MKELLIYFYAESPVHAGASDSEEDIDLPIQREAHSRYPVIYGQSLRGALRHAAEEYFSRKGSENQGAGESGDRKNGSGSATVERWFGSAPTVGGPTTPGSISVGDAQLVAMPVPSLRRTFAWVTSTVALGRLARKYRAIGRPLDAAVPKDPSKAHASGSGWEGEQMLGPIRIGVRESGKTSMDTWADLLVRDALPDEAPFIGFTDKLDEDLILVPSDAMAVLVEECTEVNVRVQLDENKTVAHGPFQSEYLPTETLLAATISLHSGFTDTDVRQLKELLGGSGTALHRIGGDESLGKGLVWTRVVDGGPR